MTVSVRRRHPHACPGGELGGGELSRNRVVRDQVRRDGSINRRRLGRTRAECKEHHGSNRRQRHQRATSTDTRGRPVWRPFRSRPRTRSSRPSGRSGHCSWEWLSWSRCRHAAASTELPADDTDGLVSRRVLSVSKSPTEGKRSSKSTEAASGSLRANHAAEDEVVTGRDDADKGHRRVEPHGRPRGHPSHRLHPTVDNQRLQSLPPPLPGTCALLRGRPQ